MTNPLTPDRERALLERVAFEPRAFQPLYAYYFPKLYAYVSYRVGRVADTEDIVADTFLRAVERLDQFEWRGAGSFAAWLFQIARHRLADFYRQSGRSNQTVSWDDLPDIEAHELLPADGVLRREIFAQLRQLIGTLSPRRQEIITLRFFGGLRNQEIARLLDLDERTVASHLSRGLEDLQRKYRAEFASEFVSMEEGNQR